MWRITPPPAPAGFPDSHLLPPKLSKTDAHFHDMGVEFVETVEGISLAELNDLFERVGRRRAGVCVCGGGGGSAGRGLG